MKLDLSELLSRPGMRYDYPVDEPPIVDEDLECTDRVSGHLVFTNTGSVLLIEGDASTRVALACSRCLAYYEQPVSTAITEQFTLATHTGPSGRPGMTVVEEDENPDAGKLFAGHLLDLTELLRQNVSLALPSQPLHDENCKGLCPQCGKDRNEGECGCPAEPANPAFAQLAGLIHPDEPGPESG